MNTCTKVFLRKKEISGDRIRSTSTSIPRSEILTPTGSAAVRAWESTSTDIQLMPVNASMMEKAEAIRCRRFEQLLNEQFGFLDKEKLRIDFLEYFRKKCFKKYQKWKIVYQHFYDFCDGTFTLAKINEDFCKKFQAYLLKGGRRDGRKSKLAHNSIVGYFVIRCKIKDRLYQNAIQYQIS